MGEHSSQTEERGTIRLLSTGPIQVEGNLPLVVGQPLEVVPRTENIEIAFREHRLLRAALVELMAAARPWLEPGSRANVAMHQARAALEGRDSDDRK